MKFLKSLFQVISSKKITQTLLNLLILFLIVLLLDITKEVWGGAFSIFWKIIKPFFVAFAIAYVLNPLIEWVQKYVKNRGLSLIIVYVGIIACLILILSLAIPLVINSVTDLYPAFEDGLIFISRFVQSHLGFNISEITTYIQTEAAKLLQDMTVINTTFDVLNSVIVKIGNGLIYSILAIYMSIKFDSIRIAINHFAGKFDENLQNPPHSTWTDRSQRQGAVHRHDRPAVIPGGAGRIADAQAGIYLPGRRSFFHQPPDPLQANLGGAISRLPAGSGGRAGGMRFRGLGRPQRGGTAKRSAFSTLDGRRQRGQNSRRRECRRLSKAGDGGLRGAGAGIDAFGGYRSGGLHPRRRDHAADDGLRSSQAGNERLCGGKRQRLHAAHHAFRLDAGAGGRGAVHDSLESGGIKRVRRWLTR